MRVDLMGTPEVAAAAVVLLCGWMAHVEAPAVFSSPRFRLAESESRGLLESARALAQVAKPVAVALEVAGEGTEFWVQTSRLAPERKRRVPALPLDESVGPDDAVLVYGGNVRLRVRAAALTQIAEDYDVAWVWAGAAGPASDPPQAVQFFPRADREGVAWYLRLGAWRDGRSSSAVWLAAEPPDA